MASEGIPVMFQLVSLLVVPLTTRRGAAWRLAPQSYGHATTIDFVHA